MFRIYCFSLSYQPRSDLFSNMIQHFDLCSMKHNSMSNAHTCIQSILFMLCTNLTQIIFYFNYCKFSNTNRFSAEYLFHIRYQNFFLSCTGPYSKILLTSSPFLPQNSLFWLFYLSCTQIIRELVYTRFYNIFLLIIITILMDTY